MKYFLWRYSRAIFAWSIVLMSAAFGVGRFWIPGHDPSLPGTYEAFAHIWVGALLALAILKADARKLSLLALALITAIETFKFFHQ